MRQEKFKMERQGLIEIGDEIEISKSTESGEIPLSYSGWKDNL